MNELTQNIQKMMVPKAAIIAYKYEDRRNSDTRYFIELRPIGKSGQMGAGIPVTYEFMNTLLESYTEEMSGIPAGRIPENMLACNPRKGQEEYIWYNPPEKEKTLILPIATSTEFQRSFAGSGYVWNLSQSDITQCELLLSQAKLSECKEISLLTSDDDYGKSF